MIALTPANTDPSMTHTPTSNLDRKFTTGHAQYALQSFTFTKSLGVEVQTNRARIGGTGRQDRSGGTDGQDRSGGTDRQG